MGRNGDGIREASSSSYEISFTYMGERCRERIRLKPSPANHKKVANYLGTICSAIELNNFDYSISFPDSPRAKKFSMGPISGPTVKEYMLSWIDKRATQLKDSTIRQYTNITNQMLIPTIGDIRLSELKRNDVKEIVMSNPAGNRRLAGIQSVLRTALTDAVEDELIDSNVLLGWKFKRKDAPVASDVNPFSKEEQARILSKVSGQVRNQFIFSFWTGLRPSELIALDWDDVDWVRREVYIMKVRTRNSTKPERTKTPAGTRWVDLLGPAYDALLAQKAHTFLAGREIFQNPGTGTRWRGDDRIRDVWVRALKLSGVKYRRLYQTRHTYASMMISSGENPSWVADQMGHKDWGMIRKTYAKFMPDSVENAGSKAVEKYGANAVINAVIVPHK